METRSKSVYGATEYKPGTCREVYPKSSTGLQTDRLASLLPLNCTAPAHGARRTAVTRRKRATPCSYDMTFSSSYYSTVLYGAPPPPSAARRVRINVGARTPYCVRSSRGHQRRRIHHIGDREPPTAERRAMGNGQRATRPRNQSPHNSNPCNCICKYVLRMSPARICIASASHRK